MFSGSVGSIDSVRTVLGGRDRRKGRFMGKTCCGTRKFNLMPAKYLGKMNKKVVGETQGRRKAMVLFLGTIYVFHSNWLLPASTEETSKLCFHRESLPPASLPPHSCFAMVQAPGHPQGQLEASWTRSSLWLTLLAGTSCNSSGEAGCAASSGNGYFSPWGGW